MASLSRLMATAFAATVIAASPFSSHAQDDDCPTVCDQNGCHTDCSSKSPPGESRPSQMGTRCQTSFGICGVSPQPQGSQCYCTDPRTGRIDPGRTIP